jgi:hypothetical protein
MVATLVARNAKRLWWGLAVSAFGGRMESDGRLYVDAFGRNLSGFSRREDVFTSNLLNKKFDKLCTFNAICEGN